MTVEAFRYALSEVTGVPLGMSLTRDWLGASIALTCGRSYEGHEERWSAESEVTPGSNLTIQETARNAKLNATPVRLAFLDETNVWVTLDSGGDGDRSCF